ncbi:hypothetical protein [Streptomyces atacamensis]|uniref:hypothetical protein n=1 Tax=Streptomyces atacamensis TaxID=531966 RepID=UPI00399CB589
MSTKTAAGFRANAEGRRLFLAAIAAAIEAEQYEYAIARVIAEGPALGPRKAAWVDACQWVKAVADEGKMTPRWTALQASIQLAHGNI